MKIYTSFKGREKIFSLWKENTRKRYDLRKYHDSNNRWIKKNYLQHFMFAYGEEAFDYKKTEFKINQIIKEGLDDTLSKEEFQTSGGCYAPRRINRFNAGGAISRHAWGIAIDINVKSGYHPRVVEIFNSWGFAWGGTWTSPDEMHFELRDLSPSISQASS